MSTREAEREERFTDKLKSNSGKVSVTTRTRGDRDLRTN